jgi:hypothetical protein
MSALAAAPLTDGIAKEIRMAATLTTIRISMMVIPRDREMDGMGFVKVIFPYGFRLSSLLFNGVREYAAPIANP